MSRIQYTKTPTPQPYRHQEYPKLLYKAGEPRPATVISVEQEKDFLARGWQTGHIEPPPPPRPKTEVDEAVEARDNVHRAEMKYFREKYEDQIGLLGAELSDAKAKHAALVDDFESASVERHELKKQNASLVEELKAANNRADDLVAQLGQAQHEIAELRKKAPIAPKFPNHKKEE